MFEWNGKIFSVFTSEEKTVLKLIKSMGNQLNHATDMLPKIFDDYTAKLKDKTDRKGNHEGSWQGLNKPTLSDEGMRATVEKINDVDIPSINSQLAENVNDVSDRGINVKTYGIKGDGTNETTTIQNLLNKGGHIFFPKGTYLFDKLIVNKDNTILEFSESVILKSPYKGNTLEEGAISIEGIKGVVKNITQNIEKGTNTITLNDVTGISIGTILKLEQNIPSPIDYTTFKYAYSYAIVTVKAINGTVITLEESLSHEYNLEYQPKAYIVTLVRNVKIIGHNTLFDKMGTTEYSSHFHINYAKDFYISGFECINGGGKAVVVRNTHTFTIDDITHKNPTNVAAGHGYGVQIIEGSSYGIIKNLKCYESRHGVDFSSGSHNCIVDSCYCFKSGISGHGMNTKNIKIVNCTIDGNPFGVGNYTFFYDSEWEFINCTVVNSDKGFSINNKSFGIKITNCSIKNCKIGISLLGTSNSVISQIDMKDCYTGIEMQQNTNNVILTSINATNTKDIITSQTSGFVTIEADCSFIKIYDSQIQTPHFICILSSGDNSLNTFLKISNCLLESTHSANGRQSIRAFNKNVNLTNNILKSDVLLVADSNYIFSNNEMNGVKIDIRSTKNTIIVGNIGNTFAFNTPANNDTNKVIVANNITTLI